MKNALKWIGICLVVLIVCLIVVLGASQFLPPGSTLGDDVLIALAGVVLSIIFTYMPGLRVVYGGLVTETKQLIQLILIITIAGITFAFTCTNFWLVPGVDCSKQGLITLIIYIFLAAGGNQLTYKLSPQPGDVKTAIAERDLSQG
ncbi:MAG: hypothetical protein ABFD14_03925 [Anaerolineaceae bacterium]